MIQMEAAKSFVLGYTGQKLVRLFLLKFLAASLVAAWLLTCKRVLYCITIPISALGGASRSSRLLENSIHVLTFQFQQLPCHVAHFLFLFHSIYPAAGASRSVFVNFILILCVALAARIWWETNPYFPAAAEKRRPRARRFHLSPDASHLPQPQADPKYNSRWRENVRSTVVEHAWETLCGSIVQEFIYDTWYHYLSPDKEFPAEIRRILNHAFGQLAVRARTLDLRLIMEDASELLMEQLELYRDTRESVIADAQQNSAVAAALTQGDLATRERLLRERMEADGNLHPALLHPEGDYKMLTAVSGGLVGFLLDPADNSRAAVRAVARELLAGCVLRPLMMWCTPYHVNRGLYKLLEEQASRRPASSLGGGLQRDMSEVDLAKTKAMQGHWEFEQRIV